MMNQEQNKAPAFESQKFLTGFSVTKTYKIWFAVSGALVLASLVLFFVWGLAPGIEFRGGSLAELEFESPVEARSIQQELQSAGFADASAQSSSERIVLIKTGHLESAELDRFKQILAERFGNSRELRFESIGPAIGKELVRRAYLQIFLVVVCIILYIAYSFRKVSMSAQTAKISSWKLGLAAIVTLLHNLIITVGLFVVLGRLAGVDVDSLFVTALLTVLGFSVHDTIVVFDRFREALGKYKFKAMDSIIDFSVNSTLARSINTGSALIFMMIAMLFFGGAAIFYFVLALLVGVVVGTYSSIFIASPLIYLWQTSTTRKK